jgi:hypothetical protein
VALQLTVEQCQASAGRGRTAPWRAGVFGNRKRLGNAHERRHRGHGRGEDASTTRRGERGGESYVTTEPRDEWGPLIGSPEQVAADIARAADMGVEHIYWNTDEDPLRQLPLLAQLRRG